MCNELFVHLCEPRHVLGKDRIAQDRDAEALMLRMVVVHWLQDLAACFE